MELGVFLSSFPHCGCFLLSLYLGRSSGRLCERVNAHVSAILAAHTKLQEERMDKKTIEKIDAILSKGDRVELIPNKDGVRVIHIIRRAVK